MEKLYRSLLIKLSEILVMKNNSRITRRTNPLLVILLTFLVSSYGYSQTAIAPSGSGTSGSPYQISSIENLYWISQNTSSWNSYFEQTADIDASSTANWDDGNGGDAEGFSPIGISFSDDFGGTYNGNGYTISGLTINRTVGDAIGLFGIAYRADVSNLTLENVDISCTASTYCGALVGLTGSSSEYSNISVSGSVTGNRNLGGIIGWISQSQISNSHFNGNVTGVSALGGLVGNLYLSTATTSSAKGTISGNGTGSSTNVGGLVGSNDQSSTISFSFADVHVSGVYSSAGGLVGNNNQSSSINNSYALGTVNGTVNIGGLVGTNNSSSSITDSYSTGAASGSFNFAGLLGSNSGGTITGSFWNTETSGLSTGIASDNNSQSVTGLNKEEMLEESSFSGLDFTADWKIYEQLSYPFLQSNVPDTLPGGLALPLGSGTEADPFKISTLDHLRIVSADTSYWNEHFIQTANIDASATATWDDGNGGDPEGFSPIGNSTLSFTGSYNGQEYSISNLYINRASFRQGFIGDADGASFNNVSLLNINYTSTQYSGGLVGWGANLTIDNTSVSGQIMGTIMVGGLVGITQGLNHISNSSANVNVLIDLTGTNPNSYAGGLIGQTFSILEGSYISNSNASGNVTGKNRVGGLIGNSEIEVRNSHATGTVIGELQSGGLIGWSFKTVSESYATGNVTGTIYVGGLVGYANGETLKNYATGNVNGTEYVGGLVGYFTSHISNNFATGDVSGERRVGGLAGVGTIGASNNYASGLVTGIELTGGVVGLLSSNHQTTQNNYWDVENSGQTDGFGISFSSATPPTGLTTTQMYQKSSFSGFDFDSVWAAHSNFTKPYLQANHKDTVEGFDVDIFTLNGTGTEADPYQIATLPNLSWLSETDSVWNDHFVQMANIDASFSAVWDDSVGFSPIGTFENQFTGNYDGGDYTISNLTINRIDSTFGAMFGYVSSTGDISNLGVLDVLIKGKDAIGLVHINRGSITNVHTTGSITGASNSAGLVYFNFGTITGSHSSATINSGGKAGGLVTWNLHDGIITNSYATGDVNGGVIVGGFSAENYGTISQSFSTGAVDGGVRVGGFNGTNFGIITDSYSTANIEANYEAGGFVGANYTSGSISRSYATGLITPENNTDIGGFIGNNNGGTVTDSYWDSTSTGQTLAFGSDDNSQTATGLSTSQTKTQSNYSGFDFSSVWTIHNNFTRPYLQSNHGDSVDGYDLDFFTLNGTGSSGNPYQMATLANLSWLSENVSAWDNHIIQTADIDASETAAWNDSLGFSPIGTNNSARFQGEYDGDGYNISGLTIRRENQDNIGLFGYVNNFGKVENVGMIDANITGRSNVGGLIGQSTNATVTNSYSAGKVTSSSFRVGGLIGYANSTTITGTYSKASVQSDGGSNIGGLIGELDNSTLSLSYATGDVSGGARVGGLIGTSPANVITDSYATGNVQSSSFYAGGLIGGFGTQFTTEDSLKNSYSTGTVTGSAAGGLIGQNRGTVLGSYWDTESSGLGDGIGEDYNSQSVIGLTSQQMVQQNSFSDFDFESVWSIESHFTTPYITSNKPDSINGYDYSTFVIGGSGTEADPYQIGSLANMYWLTQNNLEWDKHYKQMEDIDFSESTVWNDGAGFSPIGNATTRFTGSFNGNGYSISNLTVKNDTSGYIGFFGNARNAQFSNISINNADILGGGSYVGVLLGFGNIVTANNIEVDGTVSGNNQAGGLAGTIWTGTISRIKSSVDVTSTVSGQVGGIIGAASSVQLSESFSTGIITGASNYTGGLIGYTSQYTTVEKSFTSGSVNGTGLVGGLVGGNTYNSSISNSYSIAKVTGNSNTGAITGYNNTNSTVSGTYWNPERSGLTVGIDYDDNSQSSTSLTIEQLKDATNFTNWDFDDTWVKANGSVLPTLQWSDYRLGGPEIKGSQGWRMFGAPFANSTFATITDSLWTQGIEGASTSKGRSNIYTWNESSQSWGIPDSINASASSGKGFMMYVFEDDSYGTPGTQGGFPKSIISEGKGISLPQTIPLSYTEGAISNLNGVNFISNPSLSTLNWEEISKTNTTSTYYVWDGDNGHYDAYQTNVGGTNSATKYIAPFQGFYVKATAASAELNIDSTAIASTDTVAYKVNNKSEIFSVLLHLENKNGLSDELRLVVRDEALDKYDEFDAPEFGSFAGSFLNISSQMDSIDLVIDSRPFAETLSYDLVFKAQNTSGQTSLSIAENKLPENWTIELVNTVTDEQFDLTQEEVSLSISETNAKPSFEPKQLRTKSSTVKPIWKVVINTTGIATSTEDEVGLPDKFSLSQNYPNPFNPSTTINYDLPKASVVKLTVFDILGRKVATLANERKEAGYHQVVFDARALASGVYLYRLEAGNNIFIKKLTLIK